MRKILERDTHITDEQNRHAHAPTDVEAIVKAATLAVLRELEHRPIPVSMHSVRPPLAARIGNWDVTTMQDWRSDGIGPKYRKIGNRVLYPLKELYEFIESHPLLGSGSIEQMQEASTK
jgi:hypothetical protein